MDDSHLFLRVATFEISKVIYNIENANQ